MKMLLELVSWAKMERIAAALLSVPRLVPKREGLSLREATPW